MGTVNGAGNIDVNSYKKAFIYYLQNCLCLDMDHSWFFY